MGIKSPDTIMGCLPAKAVKDSSKELFKIRKFIRVLKTETAK